MPISIDTIVQALDEAGLIAGRRGTLPREITSVVDDSRAVSRGALFVAVSGYRADGHDFLDSAAQRGAVAAIVEDASRTSLPCIVVREPRRAAALAASAAYGWPARDLRLVAVTGTNGKSTTVHMLRHLLDGQGGRSASIGTLGVFIGDDERLDGGKGLTTPGPVELQRVFRELVDAGVGNVSMEVSSHALDQHRVEGVTFDTAVFTTFTRDHLDYHETMGAYFAAKASLLNLLRPHATMVVNLDDPAWAALVSERRRVSFSERVTSAEVHAEGVRYSARGTELTLVLGGDRMPVSMPLLGDFNVSNALGAAAAAWALGVDTEHIAEKLGSMTQVPGRIEVLSEAPRVIRDYAHTPDALLRLLSALHPFVGGRLILVFGCGGERDRGKRPVMGAIAEANADVVILTSDNPRTENAELILDEIELGMTARSHERIEDRRKAIHRALQLWEPGDVIVLAGKGHETYQIRGTEHLPFDEKVIVGDLVREMRGQRPASKIPGARA